MDKSIKSILKLVFTVHIIIMYMRPSINETVYINTICARYKLYRT